MAVFTASDTVGPDLEEDSYDAIVDEIEEIENQFDPETMRLQITYRLLSEQRSDGTPVTVRQWVNARANAGPRSEIYKVANAVLYNNDGIPNGEPIDTDDLKGKRCRIYWAPIAKKDGTSSMGVARVSPPKTKKGGGSVAGAAGSDGAPRAKTAREQLEDEDDD